MDTQTPSKNAPSLATLSWKWMRFSAFLLIPLVYVHVVLQDLIVGGRNLSLGYVAGRWALWGWRVYDIFLLAFAFSHGLNGLRQVLCDFVKTEQSRRILNWGLLLFWLLIIFIGAAAIIGGVQHP